jgi:hypothetical protein
MLLLRWVGALFVTLLALLVLVITLPRLAHPATTGDWLLLRRCALPCWNGIIVGKTSGKDAEAILRRAATIRMIATSPMNLDFLVTTPIGDVLGTIFLVPDESGIPYVYFIRFTKGKYVSEGLIDQRKQYFPRLMGYGFYMAPNHDLFTGDQAVFLAHYSDIQHLFLTCSLNAGAINVNLLIGPPPYAQVMVNRAFCA